ILASIIAILAFEIFKSIITSLWIFGAAVLLSLLIFLLICGLTGAIKKSDVDSIRKSISEGGLLQSAIVPLLDAYQIILRNPSRNDESIKISVRNEVIQDLLASLQSTKNGPLFIVGSRKRWHVLGNPITNFRAKLIGEWWYVNNTNALYTIRNRMLNGVQLLFILSHVPKLRMNNLLNLKIISPQPFRYNINGQSGASNEIALVPLPMHLDKTLYVEYCSVTLIADGILSYLPKYVYGMIFALDSFINRIAGIFRTQLQRRKDVDLNRIQYIFLGPKSQRNFVDVHSLECQVHVERTLIGKGLASILPITNTWWIHDVFVKPAFRRQGIGEILLIQILNHLKQKNARTVNVSMSVTNETGINLYQRVGFQRTRRCVLLEQILSDKTKLSPHWTSEERLVMEKDLALI
ncbi:MAG: GNAT family N-acetyltransferase, partial [Candidatus Thorarchaeota archaeon]|nr:GNAT family N-acetyltransferase [Candidatus Thorarchaeota archaeon]